MIGLQQQPKLPAFKFTVAVEFWDGSKTFDVKVWESGRVLCLDSFGGQPTNQITDQRSALMLSDQILQAVDLDKCGGVHLGQKWVLVLEFWTELNRAVTYPRMAFRLHQGGDPVPDPSPLVLPLPGMDKPASRVDNNDIALDIARRVLQSAKWSIQNKKTTMLQAGGAS